MQFDAIQRIIQNGSIRFREELSTIFENAEQSSLSQNSLEAAAKGKIDGFASYLINYIKDKKREQDTSVGSEILPIFEEQQKFQTDVLNEQIKRREYVLMKQRESFYKQLNALKLQLEQKGRMGEAFIPQEVEFYDPKNLDAIFAKENEKDEEQLRKRITTQVTLKFANFHQEEMRKIENRIQKMKEENQQLIEQKEQEMQQREERLNQYIAMIEEEKKKNEEASNQEIEELKLTSSNQLQETIEKFQREKKDTLILAAQDHRQKLEEMDKTYVQQISQLEKQIQDLGENNAQGDNRVQRLDEKISELKRELKEQQHEKKKTLDENEKLHQVIQDKTLQISTLELQLLDARYKLEEHQSEQKPDISTKGSQKGISVVKKEQDWHQREQELLKKIIYLEEREKKQIEKDNIFVTQFGNVMHSDPSSSSLINYQTNSVSSNLQLQPLDVKKTSQKVQLSELEQAIEKDKELKKQQLNTNWALFKSELIRNSKIKLDPLEIQQANENPKSPSQTQTDKQTVKQSKNLDFIKRQEQKQKEKIERLANLKQRIMQQRQDNLLKVLNGAVIVQIPTQPKIQPDQWQNYVDTTIIEQNVDQTQPNQTSSVQSPDKKSYLHTNQPSHLKSPQTRQTSQSPPSLQNQQNQSSFQKQMSPQSMNHPLTQSLQTSSINQTIQNTNPYSNVQGAQYQSVSPNTNIPISLSASYPISSQPRNSVISSQNPNQPNQQPIEVQSSQIQSPIHSQSPHIKSTSQQQADQQIQDQTQSNKPSSSLSSHIPYSQQIQTQFYSSFGPIPSQLQTQQYSQQSRPKPSSFSAPNADSISDYNQPSSSNQLIQTQSSQPQSANIPTSQQQSRPKPSSSSSSSSHSPLSSSFTSPHQSNINQQQQKPSTSSQLHKPNYASHTRAKTTSITSRAPVYQSIEQKVPLDSDYWINNNQDSSTNEQYAYSAKEHPKIPNSSQVKQNNNNIDSSTVNYETLAKNLKEQFRGRRISVINENIFNESIKQKPSISIHNTIKSTGNSTYEFQQDQKYQKVQEKRNQTSGQTQRKQEISNINNKNLFFNQQQELFVITPTRPSTTEKAYIHSVPSIPLDQTSSVRVNLQKLDRNDSFINVNNTTESGNPNQLTSTQELDGSQDYKSTSFQHDLNTNRSSTVSLSQKWHQFFSSQNNPSQKQKKYTNQSLNSSTSTPRNTFSGRSQQISNNLHNSQSPPSHKRKF